MGDCLRRLLRQLPALAWAALALLPCLTTLPLVTRWEASAWQIAATSCWYLAVAWLALPHRAFVALTVPLVFAGAVVSAADWMDSVNLLELLAVAYTFRPEEIAATLQARMLALAGLALALCAMLVVAWRSPPAAGRSRPALAAVALCGAGMALAFPAAAWREAWPFNLAGAIQDGLAGNHGIGLPDLERIRHSPRDRFQDWGARRGETPAAREVYLLVVGESVRSDRVPGCGGRKGITPPPAGALTYCDMLAGASATHSSVPLLISRGLPGWRERVPADASFIRAFETVGFETFWLGVQERSIAWPDAANQAFEPTPRTDRQALLPLLDAALARPSPRKLIVLHAYNAHGPYHERYEASNAPFAADPARLKGSPSRTDLAIWWNAYDNAIDESMRFLGAITARLDALDAQVFLAYTPDHGENMLDDVRGLTLHALKRPTLWDTRVPLVVWSSRAWRAAHADRWAQLENNVDAALMHMDVVPTLLGAAGVQFDEHRTLPIDLTRGKVPARTRFTQVRPGETVTFEALLREAGR